MALNNKSRTENAKSNAIFAFARRFVNIVLVFVSRRFFIKYIGVAYLGINGLFADVLTLLSLAELGISTAMNVSLYKPIAEKDTDKLSAIISYFSKIYMCIAAAVTVIGFALIPFLKYMVNMEQDIPHLYLYYIIFVLKNSVSYLLVYKSSILFADQKMALVSKAEIWTTMAKTVLQIVVIILFKNYLLYILMEVAYVLARNIYVSHVANKEYPFLKKKVALDSEEKKRIGSNIFSLFVYKISFVIINGTDNILISMLIGTIYVGKYSNYNSVSSSIESIVGLVFISLTASVGNLIATSNEENRYRVFKTSQMASFTICGIICAGLMFLFQDFIFLWLGNEEMLLDTKTVAAIVLYLFYQICMRPVWIFREGTGMYKLIKYVMLVTAAVNVIISIILGKLMGLSGILFGTTIANMLTCFWYEPKLLFKRFFGKSPWLYYRDFFINAIITAGGMLLCYFAVRNITTVSILNFIIKGVICVAIMGAVYAVRYCRTPEFKALAGKAVKKIMPGGK